MGNPRGFLDFQRVELIKLEPEERIKIIESLANCQAKRTGKAGRKMYELRSAFLSSWKN